MGDTNDFDLPQSSQSGNVDIGHLSENVQSEESRILQESATRLSTILSDFYSGNTDDNQLYNQLIEAGYTEDRSDNLLTSAQVERTYRNTHNDESSALSPNQLQYLYNQGLSGLDLTNLQIVTVRGGSGDRPRTAVLDFRSSDPEGNPTQVFLPPPQQFDPVTRATRSELRRDETYLSFITLQDPQPDNIHLYQDKLDQPTINAVSQILTQYFQQTGQPGNDQRREEMYARIQSLPGMQNQRNIRAKLVDLFRSVAEEQQYRVMNDGRPRGLTDEQWEALSTGGESVGFYGQPILMTDTIPPIRYIVSGTQIIEIDDNIQDTITRQRDFTTADLSQINLARLSFFEDPTTSAEDLRQNIVNIVKLNPDIDSDLSLGFQIDDIVDETVRERQFRSQNNGRPSGISQLQYDFMLNHVLAMNEPRYTGEPLETTTLSDGTTAYGFNSWDSNIPDFMIIPSDTIIRQMIQSGVYVIPEQAEPTIDPEPEQPAEDYRDQRIITVIGQDRFNNLSPEQINTLRDVVNTKGDLITEYNRLGINIIPPDTRIEPSITGAGIPHDRLPVPPLVPPPPVVAGQTQPIDPISGIPIVVPTPAEQVERFEQYFNDNQESFMSFRTAFRTILPVMTATAIGSFSFMLAKIRDKNTIRTFVEEQRTLLETLQNRLDDNFRSVENIERLLPNLQGRLEFAQTNIPQIISQLEPDSPFRQGLASADIQVQRATLIELQKSINSITTEYQAINTLIETLTIETDRLSADSEASRVYSQEIDEQLRTIINTDYTLLEDVARFFPQILSGVSIGFTLGSVLSGYLFPTYMNINEPYVTADNIEYTPPKQKKDKEVKQPEQMKDNDFIFASSVLEMKEPLYKSSRIVKPINEQFIPYKSNRGKTLSYREIQELKSTLNKNELENLRKKHLIFGDDGKVNMIPTEDKCLNVVGETILHQRPVKI